MTFAESSARKPRTRRLRRVCVGISTQRPKPVAIWTTIPKTFLRRNDWRLRRSMACCSAASAPWHCGRRLRVTGASITSFGTDAIVAFLIFLSAVSVAYLLMFTAAGGQTVGKMLMGLRVVGDAVDSIDDQLTMPQAALRAVLAPLSVLALGLGWLPALFGRGLALHDRLAHTRVVRV